MSEQLKLTEEEFSQTLDLRNRISSNVQTLGRLNVRKHFAEMDLQEINSQIQSALKETEDLSAEETRLISEITSKYGQGNLDFSTGVYTPTGSTEGNSAE